MSEIKATHVRWHAGELSRQERWERLRGHGATVWFTGLSGSGKSTIASRLERALVEEGVSAYRLDGDNLRHGLNANLSFSAADREENIRRVGEVAVLFADAGVVTLASFISPFARDRARVRAQHQTRGLPFFEVFVDTPLEVCEARDPKGLYAKARKGEIPSFTGVSDPYEPPEAPDLLLRTATRSIDACVEDCMALLIRAGVLPSLAPDHAAD